MSQGDQHLPSDVACGVVICLDPCSVLAVQDDTVLESDVCHVVVAFSTDAADAEAVTA